MTESAALLAELRRIAAGDTVRAVAQASGEDWPHSGLSAAQLHEIYAAEAEDEAAAIGFAVALTLAAQALPLLWIRTAAPGRILAGGLWEIGLPPDALMLVAAADSAALLRTAAPPF